MRFLLDFIYIVLGIVASPYILFRMATSRRWRAGFSQRLGFIPSRETLDRTCVWIHMVSVGEVSAAQPLVTAIEQACPDWDIRVSTITNTGQKVARERYGAGRCFYFPLDLSWAVKRAFRRVSPDVLVLVELELWPNVLRVARARGCPVVVVNGRMREERVSRYRALRFLFAPAFDRSTRNLFCVQNETYRDRFERAGIPCDRINVTGNMKYDAVNFALEPARLDALRSELGLAPDARLWVAGCTWSGEEAICLRVHRQLFASDPALRLAIAPRHIERAGDVEREIVQAGFSCYRRTDLNGAEDSSAIILLDTVGELSYVYSLAEFAFVGKSLTATGGHNMLEPAAFGATPLFGPLTDNFDDAAELLLNAGAAERVADESALQAAASRLLGDAALRRNRAERGREIVMRNGGACIKHMNVLRNLMANTKRA